MLEVLMGDPDVDGDHPWHRAERGELDTTEIQGQLEPYADGPGRHAPRRRDRRDPRPEGLRAAGRPPRPDHLVAGRGLPNGPRDQQLPRVPPDPGGAARPAEALRRRGRLVPGRRPQAVSPTVRDPPRPAGPARRPSAVPRRLRRQRRRRPGCGPAHDPRHRRPRRPRRARRRPRPAGRLRTAADPAPARPPLDAAGGGRSWRWCSPAEQPEPWNSRCGDGVRPGREPARCAPVRARPGPRRAGLVARRGPAALPAARRRGRAARLPPLLGGRAPQHARHRQLLAGGAAGPRRQRHLHDPDRLGRRHAAEPRAARGRRAVRDARGAPPRPRRPRDRPRARHRPGHGAGPAPLAPTAFTEEEFPEQLGELFGFFDGGFPDHHPYRNITAVPGARLPTRPVAAGIERLQRPRGRRARPAVLLRPPLRGRPTPMPALAAYRASFRPSEDLARPYAMLGVAVVCADTDEQASLAGRPERAGDRPAAVRAARRVPHARGGSRLPLHRGGAPGGDGAGPPRTSSAAPTPSGASSASSSSAPAPTS